MNERAVASDLSTATEGDGRPAVALGVVVTSIALALFGIGLTLITRPDWHVNQWFWAVDTVDAVVYGVVAWLVLSRLRNAVAWILAVTAVGGGLAAVAAQWSTLWYEHPDLPELRAFQLLQGLGWVPGTLALIVVLPWLVREGRPTTLSRVMVAAGAALIAWTVFGRLTDPFLSPSGQPYSPFAIRSPDWGEFLEGVARAENGVLVALGLLAAADVWRRGRRLADADRRAYAWLAIAVAALSVTFLPLALPEEVSSRLPLAFTPLLHLLSQALYPAAIAGVLLRRRLWGIDLAVRRTLTWWMLTSGLVLTYVAVVAVLGQVLPDDGGFVPVLATALIAAGFQPARRWVQDHVDALVHGDARQPERVVRRLSRTLGSATDHDTLLVGLLDSLVASLRLGGARVEVLTEAAAVVLATTGQVEGATVTVPLHHHQEEVGRLTVAPRPNERLDGRTLAAIDDLAPVLAATLALASTTAELRQSRERLAEARDEERRVLRRELHDGLGPALAGIGLGLQASRNLLAADPAAAGELLDTLATELDARVEEVRGLARGLLPPALEELGLQPALEELADRYRSSGLAVDLDLDGLHRVGPDVGTAVYGIVSEAVRNVARHARTDRCRIEVVAGDDALRLVVSDPGVGIAAGARQGVGSRSMRERAEGLGGTLTVRSSPAEGTEVDVSLPLAAPTTTMAP